MKQRVPKKHYVGNRYVNNYNPSARYHNANLQYERQTNIADFDYELAMRTANHSWLNDIEELSKVIASNSKLPCLYRREDGSLVTNCDHCRRMNVMRRNFILLKENETL